ncbi:MAG TPA: ABC transporter ATP-binding protein [Actinomycetota bacterium]|nr:ABC transporter ATP-binding protein [Actinomycetota bacterium]
MTKTMTEAPALQVSGLWKRYGGTAALAGVDLSIAPGEILGLVGPNGAGKTTLISVVAGLLRPDQGTVRVAGVDAVAQPDAVRPLVGLAPQALGLYPTLTVRENLTFFARLAGMAPGDARARAASLGAAFGMAGSLGRRVQTLSAGEHRRIHVACAMAGRPRLLLLDEPTAGVDQAARADLLDAARSAAATGIAICYATHHLGEVEELDGSVAVLHHGRIVASGMVRSLLAAYARPVVELSFAGAPPAVAPGDGGVLQGDTLSIPTDDPGGTIARVVAAAGPDAARLRSVEVLRPGLGAVFAAVTGEPYPREAAPPEAAGAP